MNDHDEEDDPVARRCSLCALDWPDTKAYKVCPSCEEPTDRCRNVDPMDPKEAKSMAVNFEFERFYSDWDESQPADRLEPTAEDNARFR